ncbi:ABC transporter ATP-binding protein [uncultured Amnibacterium sp.]|uniref:ABC transporter ATP-binding protein n=1 Tax=uncultured Amnibacterium sp. TaxID=1631851 RepID=UPI0035CB8528
MTGVGSADAVAVRGVGKSFDGRAGATRALDAIDLTVGEGEFLTLFGPSGCGKSTLLRLIAGLDQPSEGVIHVLGSVPAQASKRKQIAWVPQNPALLPWLSIRRNAELPYRINRRADVDPAPGRSPERAETVLAELGLGDFLDHLPGQLSGGMRQRVAIARAFVQGAPIMLMDEPFSALDELTRDTLRLRLLSLWSAYRRSVVFVTHSAAEAVLLSDRVVVMSPRPGRVAAVIEVDFDRPRDAELEDTPRFAAKVAEVKRALRLGGGSDAP